LTKQTHKVLRKAYNKIVKGECIKMPGPSELDKKKTAVVILDYQINLLSSFPKETQTELLARVNKLLDIARDNKLPVFFTQRGAGKPEQEIDPRVVRKPGEVTLVKSKRAPFASTDIDERLKKLGIDTLVVTGLYTSSTVLSTMRCGTEIGYQFFVISDCCADLDMEVQEFLLKRVFYHTSTILDSKAFFELLAKS